MDVADSALDPDQIAHAKALLTAPSERERLWPALAAAGAAAASALLLATAMILAPPVTTTHLPAEDLSR